MKIEGLYRVAGGGTNFRSPPPKVLSRKPKHARILARLPMLTANADTKGRSFLPNINNKDWLVQGCQI
jgi:hypothetical protein